MNTQRYCNYVFFLIFAFLLGTFTVEAARFIENSDGTINDTKTGLIWQQSNDVDYMQWADANKYCDDLQLGGHNDWRMPDKDELFEIFNKSYYVQSGIAIDPAFKLKGHHPSSKNYYAFWTDSEFPDPKFQPLRPKYIVIFGMFREDFLGINDDIASDDHKNEVLCVRGGTIQDDNHIVQNLETSETVQASEAIPTTETTQTVETTQIPVTASPGNQYPIAVFTASKTSGRLPVRVTLNAGGSYDPDGLIQSYGWSSSDGQTAVGKTATFTFDRGRNVTITLTVADGQGAMATARQLVATDVPNQNPLASFTATPPSGTSTLDVNFDASGSSDPDGSIRSFSWHSSDGQTAKGQMVTISFDSAGTHTITLTVMDDKGGLDTEKTMITVLHDTTPPYVGIKFPLSETSLTGNILLAAEVKDESLIKGVRVFVDENLYGSMQKTSSGTWELDLSTASLPNGSHQLKVKATNNVGLIGEGTIRFDSFNEDLLATITTPRDKDTLEKTVNVDVFVGDESRIDYAVLYMDGQPFGRRLMKGPWHFRLPTARFDNGYHNLSVKLITHNGQIEWTQELSIETLNEDEASDIDVSVITPGEGEMLGSRFEVEVNTDTEDHVSFVNLNLDDEVLLETQENDSFRKNFAFDVDLSNYSDGEHTLSVYMETDTGQVGIAGPVNFTLNSNHVRKEFPEIYSFLADKESGKAPLNVFFKCGALDHDGRISKYIWNFGDGSREIITSTRTTSHTYNKAGIYQAECIVVDEEGLESASRSVSISVAGETVPRLPEIYSFLVDKKSGEAPLKVSFSCGANDPDGKINKYVWNYGDDTGERMTDYGSVYHTYQDVGTYRAECLVVDEDGLKSTSETVDIVVVEDISGVPEISSFRVDKRTGDAPLKVSFICRTDDPDGRINEYVWDFGDNTRERITASRSITHIYHDPGAYQARCTVVDVYGLEGESKPVNITVDDGVVGAWNNNSGSVIAGCATYSGFTGQLYIPCVESSHLKNNQRYEMNFSVAKHSDMVFDLDDLNQIDIKDDSQCAIIDSFYNRLHVPCVYTGQLYWADFQLIQSDNIKIKLQDYDLLEE